MPIQLTTKQKILIALAVAALITITALVLWYLLTHPVFTANVRDISLIVVAITLVVLDIALLLLMIQIIKLLQFMVVELRPILQSLQETSTTVRSTTTFVSDRVVDPAIEISSKAAGVKGSIRFVVGSILGKQPAGYRSPQDDSSAQANLWSTGAASSISTEESKTYGS